MEVKKELEEIKDESLAMSLLSDYKKQNKRFFIIWIITFLALLGLAGYTVYLLNDIGIVEETTGQEVIDSNNSTINQNIGK